MRAPVAAAILFGVSAILLAGACATEEVAGDPSDFFLPVGDQAAGREAFIELRCSYCHLVPADPAMPGLVGDTKGPDIGERQAGKTRDWIAMSIVAPGHEMPPLMREPQSPMGDYKDVMTIRQLMDVVTYVLDTE
jgi:hypothetical protein